MDRSIYDSALDFYFNEAAVLLGERGNLSSTVSALERGNASSCLYEEPLAQLESGAYHHWRDQMGLYRTTRARFNQLNGLMLRIEPQPDKYDAWLADLVQKAVSGTATDDEMKAIKDEKALWVNAQQVLTAQYSTAGRRVPHWEAVFGEIVGAVVFLAHGRDFLKLKKKEADKLERQAFYVTREAHKAWRATKPPKPKKVNLDVSFLEAPLPVAV